MSDHEATTLVAAFGHRWSGDDAFGGLVADALGPRSVPGLALLDLTECGPTGLLDALEGHVGLIVVDAVLVEGIDAGELVDLDWRETTGLASVHEQTCSTHGFSVARQLELANQLGLLPANVRLIGASLQSTHLGTSVSPAIRRAVPRAVARVTRWVNRWRKGATAAIAQRR